MLKPRLVPPLDYRFLLAGFRSGLPVSAETEPHLRAVVEEVLSHAGSLVRAQLVYGILRAHGVEASCARTASIAIEYFHTASLIFDDLPSMDDATERRGHACPHVAHGEAAAILGALAFVNQGYAQLWEVLGTLPLERRMQASQLVTSCLGVDGILNGQSIDLHFADTAQTEEDVLRVAEGKTVTLIRLTLLFPAIVAGASRLELARLDRLARSWGLSYQALDDFGDSLLTEDESGKSTARDGKLGRPNLPGSSGIGNAMRRLNVLLDEARSIVNELTHTDPRWKLLDRLQSILEGKRSEVLSRLGVADCA